MANFLFYPDVFLYLWAFLRFVFNPVTSYYVWIGILNCLTCIIAYLSMYAFCSNKTRSILFAIIYLVIPYHIFDGAWNQVLGEYIAYTFLYITIQINF